MQRWVTTLVGLAVVVLAVWLVARNFQPPKAIGKDPSPATSSSAAGDGGGLMFALGGDGGAAPVAATSDDGGPLLLSDLLGNEPRMDGGAGGTMLDGTPVPPLPLGVPRSVRFGVVLVSYAGAQPSAGGGGRPQSRSKADALVLAQRLYQTALTDFHAAVQQGDPGSSDDVGHVKLGVLEPAPEYVLFTLGGSSGNATAEGEGGTVARNDVGGPIDTPRGYWIVKRLD
jgi:hypothetical protein